MEPSYVKYKKLHELLLKEKPQKADAIVWLQGDRYDRAVKVLKLHKEGWSKKIIISGNNILIGRIARVGENNVSLDIMKDFLLKKGAREENLIIDDNSMNTKEQAEHVLKIAEEKKWTSLLLVGSSYYQPRAFLTFLKQAKKIGWSGKIINQPAVVFLGKKPAGREKTAKTLFAEEFEKIKKYKKDLVSIKQGIKYVLCS